ncbi:hypothetical protein C8R43DRAFT_962591 [Mycena crocata]|nr:hypothetical protein C8R43DRAFT_962591 [Mycena crocata]
MPSQSQPTLTQIRLNNIIMHFTSAVKTFEILAEALPAPFLEPISRTSRSLLAAVQIIHQNKTDCAQLVEKSYGLLYSIVSIHVKSTTGLELPPSITLHKIHTYVEAQQDKNKIRHLFRHGLQEAMDVFKVRNINLLADAASLKKCEEERHVELIEALSDDSISDTRSSMQRMFSGFQNSQMMESQCIGIQLNINIYAAISAQNISWS